MTIWSPPVPDSQFIPPPVGPPSIHPRVSWSCRISPFGALPFFPSFSSAPSVILPRPSGSRSPTLASISVEYILLLSLIDRRTRQLAIGILLLTSASPFLPFPFPPTLRPPPSPKMPLPKQRPIVNPHSESIHYYNLPSSRETQDSLINQWLRWKEQYNITYVSMETFVAYGRATAAAGIVSYKAYVDAAICHERSEWGRIIVPIGETIEGLKAIAHRRLNTIGRENAFILDASDRKKAKLIWDFARLSTRSVLSDRFNFSSELFLLSIALSAGIRGVALESASSFQYLFSDDSRLSSGVPSPDQQVIGLCFTVNHDKVDRPYLIPRDIFLPCACHTSRKEWCPCHDEFGRIRHPSRLPHAGLPQGRLHTLTGAWVKGATSYSHRRTVLCHFAAYLSIFLGIDIVTFANISRLNLECDLIRRRLNTHFGWTVESTSFLTYTVDASAQMFNRSIYPGYLPLFDYFKTGDLVSSVLQCVDRSFDMARALASQPITIPHQHFAQYQNSNIAAQLDVPTSSINFFKNGITIPKEKQPSPLSPHTRAESSSLLPHAQNPQPDRLNIADALSQHNTSSAPIKGDAAAQLAFFDRHSAAASRSANNLNLLNTIGASHLRDTQPHQPDLVLGPQKIANACFAPAPKRGPGRPRKQLETHGLNLGLLVPEGAKQPPPKRVETPPGFEDVSGTGFVKIGRPKKCPVESDFISSRHFQKFWAKRRAMMGDSVGILRFPPDFRECESPPHSVVSSEYPPQIHRRSPLRGYCRTHEGFA